MELVLVFNALFLVSFFLQLLFSIFLGIDKVNQNLVVRVQVFFLKFFIIRKSWL